MDINSIKGTGLTSQSSREKLIHELKGLGIKNSEVLNLISNMPRHLFLDTALANRAYENVSLPIGFKQTISQPYMVAKMTELLHETNSMNHVLEIGTGSGYQASILSLLCRRVYTIERIETLHHFSNKKFKELSLSNITAKHANGSNGWPETSPFDRIILTCAIKEIQKQLFLQLKVGCILVGPEILDNKDQVLNMYTRKEKNKFEKKSVENVKFVPML